MASKPPIVRPDLIKFSVRTGKTVQRKHIRWVMGWLRPVRCPACRVPTKQVPAAEQGGEVARKCLCCLTTFTKGDARRESRKGRR